MSASIEHVHETLTGSPSKNDDTEEKLYNTLKEWGFREGIIEEGRVGIDVSQRVKSYGDDYAKHLEETYGHKHPFLAATAAGRGYEPGKMGEKSIDAVEKMADPEQKAVVDASTVQDAVPIIVDPMVVDIQRSRAPVLDRISVQAQQGYEAKYNVISERSPPIGYAGEADIIDLSDLDVGDFGMETDSEDMKIYVDQVNISDFSQRATDSLNYMNLENTTLGQRTIVWALTKAASYFYADTTAGETGFGYSSLGTDNAFDGFTRIAEQRNNDMDRTTVDSSGDGQPLLEDIKNQLTIQVENTGLTYADAEIFVSSAMFDKLENEGNPVTRLTSFSEGINFGARQLSIKNVPVTECPNISPNFELPWDTDDTNPIVDDGNVFIVDRSAMQFRALAPLFTLPLGRIGLADRAAMAEYGTLIDKSHGEHTLWLQYAI